MKTFQQIYDFCKWDRTYQAYYDINNYYFCSHKERKYFYSILSQEGFSRTNWIEQQSAIQLNRFILNQQKKYYFHIDLITYSIVHYDWEKYWRIFVISEIQKDGVRICFQNPFSIVGDNKISFTPRSHRIYDSKGIIEEIKAYMDKYFLEPAGDLRDLQIQYRLTKEEVQSMSFKKYK